MQPSRFLNKRCLMQNLLNKFHQKNFNIRYNQTLKSSIFLGNKDTFKFTDYDCIGFDLDNTLCKYNVGPMLKMEYETLSKYLVEKKNYPSKYLLRPVDENLDFLMKGLILDFHKGNVLKIDSTGKIIRASHGTKQLTDNEIEKYYGQKKHWNVTDVFANDFLSTWNGPLSEQMRSLLDYFDIPTCLAFARIVDSLDEHNNRFERTYNVWPDLLAGLIDMFDINNYKLNKGGYFPSMKANPELYITKCSTDILNWLQSLKNNNKILFLITGSYVDFASLTSKTCMGENWSKLFDIVIFYAKKPGFFTENRPFISVETEKEINGNLKRNDWYVQGNWKDLIKFLSIVSNKENPKVAYVGDNLIQDIYTPAVHSFCDTVAIVEELEAEGIFGFNSSHKDAKYLCSKQWGSFFMENKEETIESVWFKIIRNHAKLCVPNMDYLASKPIDYEFKKGFY